MKILILSDTHGQTEDAEAVIRREKPDQVIHLGDCLRDAEDLRQTFPSLPICAVPGNNDWFFDESKEKVILLNGTRIFLCHGHTTRVKYGFDLQIAKALRENCAISLFGHTHSPYAEEERGVLLVNPGSLTYSHTYALLILSPAHPPKTEICYL